MLTGLVACGGGKEETPSHSLTANLTVVSHGNENGPENILLAVTLNEPNTSGSAIDVELVLADGSSASELDDVLFEQGRVLSIQEGASSGSLSISVVDDALVEDTESLVLTATTQHSAVSQWSNQTVSANIIDNDASQANWNFAFSVSAHPANALMVNAQITADVATQASLTFEADGVAQRIITSNNMAAEHQLTLVGLRAETQYRIKATLTDTDNNSVETAELFITTGALPNNVPNVESLTNTSQSEGGVTFFAVANDTANSMFIGVDEEGVPVWYYHNDASMSGAPTIKSLGDGRLMLVLSREVRIISTTGETLQSYTLPAFHHDVLLLDNGHLLALTNEAQTIDGQLLQGDVIIELDTEGNLVWEWSSFEHLDTARFPGSLSTRELGSGALDWTHSNALFYDAQNHAILLSSRSQSWVVSIDRDSSELNWIMGSSEGAAASFADKFFTLERGSWMASQHAPMITRDGELLIYDNRNEAELDGRTNNSRVVRYLINHDNQSVTQTGEWIAPKYTQSLGDVDELAGGNILYNSGGPGSHNDAHIVEVTAESNSATVWEIRVPGASVYRAERISWNELLSANFNQ
ncbi:aryl-sulfate sulfotransferase [Pleionea sp. CnH1-48]|uniref:aryl-sulfate sulfotransferase n=1 Tax=Pleionea sp. CnH1-48 TaxID=2954494 RepID=UPI002097A973|nr:aryl-sulfate sulfotransferase [Pleionea sp. CnH1-48]MCO7223356.1 aryl-sulfate sulfotransferase [Pleionea sp. CnH1-48]